MKNEQGIVKVFVPNKTYTIRNPQELHDLPADLKPAVIQSTAEMVVDLTFLMEGRLVEPTLPRLYYEKCIEEYKRGLEILVGNDNLARPIQEATQRFESLTQETQLERVSRFNP